MAWVVAAIITLGALLAAVKAICDFYEWLQKKREPESDEDE